MLQITQTVRAKGRPGEQQGRQPGVAVHDAASLQRRINQLFDGGARRRCEMVFAARMAHQLLIRSVRTTARSQIGAAHAGGFDLDHRIGGFLNLRVFLELLPPVEPAEGPQGLSMTLMHPSSLFLNFS